MFAPIERLGLIVVDEEHDSSYKHEGDPRYDARHVAAAPRRSARARVLLAGSATPRPESFARLRRLVLPARADGGRAAARRGARHARRRAARCTSGRRRRSASCAASGGKGIVLLNRRGWSNFLSCRSCGKVWGCPECDVALVLHRAEGEIACHHCGHRERVPERCDALRLGQRRAPRPRAPSASSTSWRARSAATDYPMFRLDADVAAAQGPRGRRCSRASSAPPPGC